MERASELRTFSHFHILKLLFPLIFCWYFRYFVSDTYLFSGLKLHLHTYTINAVSLYNLNDSIPTKHTLRNCMYMRACGASELRKFSHFHILKLLFLSIFCWYFKYFVGTNDILVGLHIPTNFQMYGQNSEKALLGGGAISPLPPPPPPLATLMVVGYRSGIWQTCGARRGKQMG